VVGGCNGGLVSVRTEGIPLGRGARISREQVIRFSGHGGFSNEFDSRWWCTEPCSGPSGVLRPVAYTSLCFNRGRCGVECGITLFNIGALSWTSANIFGLSLSDLPTNSGGTVGYDRRMCGCDWSNWSNDEVLALVE